MDIELFKEEIKSNSISWYDSKENVVVIEEDLKAVANYQKVLNEGGVVLLLISNKNGLANTGKEGLYTKNEIENFLKKLKIDNYKFYYPLSNYKQTNTIFSDDYLPEYNNSKLLNNAFYDENSVIKYNEIEAIKTVTKAGKFVDYTNSYIVEIGKKSPIKFVSYNNSRLEEYRLVTKVFKDKVIKEPVNEKAKKHIEEIKNNIEALQGLGFNMLDRYEDGKIISKFIEGKSLYDEVLDLLFANKKEEASKVIENWYRYIKEKCKNKETTYIDLVLENTFYKDGEYLFFDQEWKQENTPLEYILYRTINNIYIYNPEISNIVRKEEMFERFDLKDTEKYQKCEKELQNQVVNIELAKKYDEEYRAKYVNTVPFEFYIKENRFSKFISKIKGKFDIRDVIIFLMTLITFVAALYIFYPGILSYDSYNQLQQIEQQQFNDWHPFFHTFIEMLCLKIWNSPASVGVFQIIVFALMWTIICRYNRKNKGNFKYQILLTFMIVANPLNYIYSITLWKDILFCYGLMFVTFLIQILVERKFVVSGNLIFLLALTISAFSSVRYNGLYIAIPTLFIICIFLFKKDRKSKNFLKLPIFTIIIIIAINHLNVIYNVAPNQKSATESKFMQIIALYINEGVVSEEDKATIGEFVSIENLLKAYNPYFSDPIYREIRGTKIADYHTDIYKMLIKYSIKHPNLLLKFYYNSAHIVWRIDRPEDTIGTIINTDITASNNVHNIQPKFKETAYYNKLNEFIKNTLDTECYSILFYSPALYLYATLVVSFILVKFFKYSKGVILILLPNILNLVIVALSTPIQDTRYVYANFLVFYLIIAILIGKTKEKEKSRN